MESAIIFAFEDNFSNSIPGSSFQRK